MTLSTSRLPGSNWYWAWLMALKLMAHIEKTVWPRLWSRSILTSTWFHRYYDDDDHDDDDDEVDNHDDSDDDDCDENYHRLVKQTWPTSVSSTEKVKMSCSLAPLKGSLILSFSSSRFTTTVVAPRSPWPTLLPVVTLSDILRNRLPPRFIFLEAPASIETTQVSQSVSQSVSDSFRQVTMQPDETDQSVSQSISQSVLQSVLGILEILGIPEILEILGSLEILGML